MAGLSAIAVSACTLDLPPRPSETAGQRLALDCGELQPNLFVSCNDGDPPRTLLETEVTPLPVPPGGEPARAEVTLPCALGLDPGRRVLARTAAACTVSESAGTLHALLELEGYVERRCGTGSQGSHGEARPVWTTTLRTPAGPDSLALLFTEATSDLSVGCALTFAGRRVSIGSGRHQALLARVPGGTTAPLVLDCSGSASTSGLALTGCFGTLPGSPVSPASDTQRIVVELRVSPTGDGG